ncbi:MAG: threonine/serine exporter family protein [Micrococcaceae bacterium]
MTREEHPTAASNDEGPFGLTTEAAPEPEPSTGQITVPVIRPAVTLPNPDAQAPQMDPSDGFGPEPAPTAALSTTETPTTEPHDLYTLPSAAPEPTPTVGALPVIPAPELPTPGRSRTRKTQTPTEPNGTRRSRGLRLPERRPRRRDEPATAPYRERMPTQVMNLVSRLETSPFAAAARKEYQKAAEAADIRNTLDFAMKLGETMFRFGAGALEVETSIIVVTQAYGVHETEIDITNQAFSLNYAPPGETPYTLQRVVRSWSQNYAGLAFLHRLVSSIAAGDTTREDAERQLAEIRHRRKPFRPWMTVAANAVFAALFVLYIGGSPLAGLVTLVSTVVVVVSMYGMARLRAPEFFTTMLGGFMATVISLGLFSMDVFKDPATVVAGILMIMLPSGRFVSAVQDGINGFPITAAGRFVSAVLTYVAMVGGIVFAAVSASQLGVPEVDVTAAPNYWYPVWMLGILVFFASAGVAAAEQSEWRLLLPTGIVSTLGFIGYEFALFLGLGPVISPAAAAVIIGFLARMVALRLGAPQLVIAVPSVLFLLPGLAIFRSMYEIAMNTGAVSGIVGMVMASIVILAVAAGSVLGDTLARPLTSKLQGNERRRIGRR